MTVRPLNRQQSPRPIREDVERPLAIRRVSAIEVQVRRC
jgi:hypothetical protein